MIELYYAEHKVHKKELEKVKKVINRYQRKIDFDFVVAYGGDGTFLSALKKFEPKPVLPIAKSDSVGFHSDNKDDAIKECLEKIVDNEFELENVAQLEVRVNGKVVGNAVNDAYVKAKFKTIDYKAELYSDSFNVRGDGFIVFTPFGSTGYNLSVNGPKIDAKANVIGFSQIATCSYNDSRSYIVPDSYDITVKIKRGIGLLYLDGEEPITVEVGDKIVCRKGESFAQLIRVNKKPLSEKLFIKWQEQLKQGL